MTKNNVEIKNITEMTIEDEANIINTIAKAYFQTDEDGNLNFTPYFSKVGKIIAVAKYMIDGIEFDDNESIYTSVINDEEINILVNDVLTLPDFQYYVDVANDIVEYKKAEYIASIQNETNSVIAYELLDLIEQEKEKTEKETETLENLNIWINEQRELNSLITPEMQRNFAENFNPESLTDAIIKKYSESDIHKKNEEIVKANKQLHEKDNKIVDLENKLKKKEHQKNVKNVISDK